MAAIGGFRSDLSITRKTDRKFWKRFRGCFVFQSHVHVSTKMVVNDRIISMPNSAITCKTERFYHQFTGDEVLSVNGTAFQGFTHKEALDTFKVIL